MTKEEFLGGIVWKDSESDGNQSVGTFKEMFSEFKALPVPTSKNGATRATIMLENPATKKVFALVMSVRLTHLFREGKLGMEEIAGFPIFKHKTHSGIYVGLPAMGWIEVKSLIVKAYTAVVDYAKLATASI
jgi:hypothetical protein